MQKNHGVHKIHMSEPAAWVLNATHWFSLLQQPMMIVIWCHNWEDASKFQYLMQILQAHYGDYVPRYQILMFDDSKIYGVLTVYTVINSKTIPFLPKMGVAPVREQSQSAIRLSDTNSWAEFVLTIYSANIARIKVPCTWERESRGQKPKSLGKVSQGRVPKVRKKSRKRSERAQKKGLD